MIITESVESASAVIEDRKSQLRSFSSRVHVDTSHTDHIDGVVGSIYDLQFFDTKHTEHITLRCGLRKPIAYTNKDHHKTNH